MKKLLCALLSAMLLAGTAGTVLPLSVSASEISFTANVTAVDTKFGGSGVYVYTNASSSPKLLNSVTWHFGSAKLLVFSADGRLIEAGENLIEERWCVQENVICPAGGFVVAFDAGQTRLESCRQFALEGAMLYNFTMSVTRSVRGSFDAAKKTLSIRYDNSPRTYDKDAPRFLFVGNSTTYVHGCPIKFQALCEAAGKSVIVDYCTKGSAYLSNYADPNHDCGQKFRKMLSEHKYDYVVLQDAVGTTAEKAVQACEVLIPLILKNGAKPVFYMRYSDSECNPTRVNNHYNIYSALAKRYDTVYAPIVVSFYRCFKTYPGIRLMADDGGHHSKEGSYLIAATWMYAFLGIDPLGNSYTADLDATTVKRLQTIAKSAIEEPFTRLPAPGVVEMTYEEGGKTYENLAEGKTYTRTGTPYTDHHTDVDGKGNLLYRLTDGLMATRPGSEENGPDRIGAFKGGTTTLTLDLGQTAHLKKVSADLWGLIAWGIPMPSAGASVTVALSTDGKTFSEEIPTVYGKLTGDDSYEGAMYSVVFDRLKDARYVRFTYVLGKLANGNQGQFAWTSEVMAYGEKSNSSELDPVPDDPEPERKKGDITGDDIVNAFDYQMVKAYVLGTFQSASDEQKAAMDVTGDGIVNAFDYQMLKAAVLGTYSFS